MSHFFQDFQKQDKQPKKIQLSLESDSESENSQYTKIIEKARKSNNIDQFFKELKKHKKQLKQNLPEEIIDFLNEIKNTKNKTKINKFLSEFKKEENPVESKMEQMNIEEKSKNNLKHNNDKPKPVNITSPSNIKKDKECNPIEKIAKINLNFKNTEIKDIVDVLDNIEIEDKNTELVVNILLSKINERLYKIKINDRQWKYYIEKLTALEKNELMQNEIKEDKHFDIINLLFILEKKYNNLTNKNNLRCLEYKYFIRENNVDNNHPEYKILYYIRNNKYLEAKELFLTESKKKYENNINTDNCSSDTIINDIEINEIIKDKRILKELGILSFKNKDIYFSYRILSSIFIDKDFKNKGINNIDNTFNIYFNNVISKSYKEYGIKYNNLKKYNLSYEEKDNISIINILYTLCILLDDKILDSEIFKYFIQDYRILGNNPFLLTNYNEGIQINKIDNIQLMNSRMELFRAYFYYRNYNYEESSRIIQTIVDMDYKEYLKERIYSRLK